MGQRNVYPRIFGVTKWERGMDGTEPVFGPPAFQLCTKEPRPVIYSLILIYLPPFSGFWYLHLYDESLYANKKSHCTVLLSIAEYCIDNESMSMTNLSFVGTATKRSITQRLCYLK
jgi:hypothetical protein